MASHIRKRDGWSWRSWNWTQRNPSRPRCQQIPSTRTCDGDLPPQKTPCSDRKFDQLAIFFCSKLGYYDVPLSNLAKMEGNFAIENCRKTPPLESRAILDKTQTPTFEERQYWTNITLTHYRRQEV